MPEISVLMCVHNREKYLADAIESILNQTFTDLEFIIVNDGSTDRSATIIQEYAQKDGRVICVENAGNLGITHSVTRGLVHCSGKYIARIDSDDLAQPQRLRLQHDFLEAHPEIDALGTAFDYMDEEGNLTGRYLVRPSDPMVIRYQMFFHCMLHNPTVMARASYYKKFNEGHQEENYIAGDDYHFWVRKNFDSLYSNLPDRLLHYRVHSTNVSVIFSTPQLEGVLQSARQGFARLLNRQIPEEVMRTFYFIRRYETADPRVARQAMLVIYQAQRAFEKQNRLNHPQKVETRQYSYEKLKSVMVKYRKLTGVMPLGILLLFLLLPGVLVKDFSRKLKKNAAQLGVEADDEG